MNYQFVELLIAQTTLFLFCMGSLHYDQGFGSVRVECVFFCFPVLVRLDSLLYLTRSVIRTRVVIEHVLEINQPQATCSGKPHQAAGLSQG